MALSVICLASFPQIQAEVYRWVDENGKVHYGDRKPKKNKAEDVSEDVSKTNIDKSQEEAAKMEKIFARETDAERKYKQKQAKKQQAAQKEQEKRCKKARKYLKTIQGPVYFVDKEGREFNISEKERAARVTEMKTLIRKNCRQG